MRKSGCTASQYIDIRRYIPEPLRLCGLLLVGLPTPGDALQNALTVLVQLQACDLEIAGSNSERYALTIALFARHTLDVNDVLETVHRCDLALTTLVAATLDDHLVVFADGNCSDL